MKGINAIETVGLLIVALIAGAVLFLFFTKLVPGVSSFMESAIQGIKDMFCRTLPLFSKWIFGC